MVSGLARILAPFCYLSLGWSLKLNFFTDFSRKFRSKLIFFRMNERMSHTINEKVHRDPTNYPYCGEMISYHKATPQLQRYLECYDQNIEMSKKYCHKARNMTHYNIIKGPKKGTRR